MGGGGSTFGGSYNVEKYKKIFRDAQSQTENASFEASANELVNALLSQHSRDADRTADHLDVIRGILEDGIDGTFDMRFGGSVQKHTYVDGLSDVDVLVILNKSDLAQSSPSEVLDFIRSKLIEHDTADIQNIKVGDLAVTVIFNDGEKIQLLPALKQSTGYKIPGMQFGHWSSIIRPEKFAKRLTEVNQTCNGKVVPVIKLAKNIIYDLPEDQQLKGYHIESLAVEIFKDYSPDKPRVPRKMLKYFFEMAKDLVKSPIRDSTGQSLHVDDYLGDTNSPERQKTGYVLDRIYRRMKNADSVGSIEEWRSILDLPEE